MANAIERAAHTVPLANAKRLGYLSGRALRFDDGSLYAAWRARCLVARRATIVISHGPRWSWLLLELDTIDPAIDLMHSDVDVLERLERPLDNFADVLQLAIPGRFRWDWASTWIRITGIRAADAHWFAQQLAPIARRIAMERRAREKLAA